MTSLQGISAPAIFDALDRHTLGRLLREVRQHIQLPENTEATIQAVLRDRNHLIHGFFAEHDVDFGSSPGCADMIDELRATTRRFQKTDKLLEGITLPLWTSLGVTREMMDAELHQMLAEVEDRKRSG